MHQQQCSIFRTDLVVADRQPCRRLRSFLLAFSCGGERRLLTSSLRSAYIQLQSAAFGHTVTRQVEQDFSSYSCSILSVHREFWIKHSNDVQIPPSGILHALVSFHGHDAPRVVLCSTTLLVAMNCLSSFQIYAMPVFDNLEAGYTGRNNKPCPRWLRSGFRALFGAAVFLIAVAFPFLSDLAGLLGGIALPVTLAYPCFMWILLNKPEKYSAMWCVNWALGSLGMGLSAVVVVGGLWRLIDTGLKVRFFKAQ